MYYGFTSENIRFNSCVGAGTTLNIGLLNVNLRSSYIRGGGGGVGWGVSNPRMYICTYFVFVGRFFRTLEFLRTKIVSFSMIMCVLDVSRTVILEEN